MLLVTFRAEEGYDGVDGLAMRGTSFHTSTVLFPTPGPSSELSQRCISH